MGLCSYFRFSNPYLHFPGSYAPSYWNPRPRVTSLMTLYNDILGLPSIHRRVVDFFIVFHHSRQCPNILMLSHVLRVR